MMRLEYFEHLDESDGEIEVCLIGADEGETEEAADGDNGAEIRSSVHLDSLEAVEEARCPGKNLSHYRGKQEMPCRQKDGEAWKR
jgi:hypothetical protein